ncbi:MAG: FemAB family PEP-CTERM system-associated protein [Planctomycetota bacterium]|nr:MAG: FemAB family PEP-CTERM system-associated protein [Planctomycetota bacterium]
MTCRIEYVSAERYPDVLDALRAFTDECNAPPPAFDPAWPLILRDGLRHVPGVLIAEEKGRIRGILPLARVESFLFGRFLVSLPYLNTGGVLTVDPQDDATARALVDRATELARTQNVRHLELRHERRIEHPALTHERTDKVHMRLTLPDSTEALWNGFRAKVRNQVRKGERMGLEVLWGREDLLNDFYRVFAHNMRDLGTPVFSKRLFAAMLRHLGENAEICVVRMGNKAVAGAILVHGRDTTEVPSASSLRRYNSTNANMLMYYHLLRRAIERGRRTFDFGRSTVNSPTFRFKKQWGAVPHPAVWQYAPTQGTMTEVRPDNPKYQRAVRLWKRLPVWFTRIVGPAIVRGIP